MSEHPILPLHLTASLEAVSDLPDRCPWQGEQAARRHVLLMPTSVSGDDLHTLLRSRGPERGWSGTSRLHLTGDASLDGPWPIPAHWREQLPIPHWLASAYTLDCPQRRGAPLPDFAAGTDLLTDAFAQAQPVGEELEALTLMRALARRCGGGLIAAGDGGPFLIAPDPETSVNLTLYSHSYLARPALQRICRSILPTLTSMVDVDADSPSGLDDLSEEHLEHLAAVAGEDAMDRAWTTQQLRAITEEDTRASVGLPDSSGLADAPHRADPAGGRPGNAASSAEPYGLFGDLSGEHPAWGGIEMQVHSDPQPPYAVSVMGAAGYLGEAGSSVPPIAYRLRWVPQEPECAFGPAPSRMIRRERRHVRRTIDSLVSTLAATLAEQGSGYAILDDDEFLTAPGSAS